MGKSAKEKVQAKVMAHNAVKYAQNRAGEAEDKLMDLAPKVRPEYHHELASDLDHKEDLLDQARSIREVARKDLRDALYSRDAHISSKGLKGAIDHWKGK